MKLPLIGVTTSRSSDPSSRPDRLLPYRQVISESYTRAIQRAGGIPLMIPFGMQSGEIVAMLARLDGVLLIGGGDIDVHRFNGKAHPAVTLVDTVRDDLELALVPAAVQRGIPLMGICRGIQVLNVALGGTLYTDIHDHYSAQIKHNNGDNVRNYLAHTVQVSPGSLLERICGKNEVWVNSLHHQGIEKLAPGLLPTAQASDGLIEAVEFEGHPFCLGVQWHPECLPDSPDMQGLFKGLIEAASH